MIISHKYKFIFLKTQKVGGTSLEIALSRFLGEDDIICPIANVDERLRQHLGYRGPQNYQVTLPRFVADVASFSAQGARYIKVALQHGHRPAMFYNHMSARLTKSIVGDAIWNDYFKFTVERNPFDKGVSYYYYRKGEAGADAISFRAFVLAGKAGNVSDFDLYSIDGIPAMDRFVLYENLSDGLDEIGSRLKLPERLSRILETIRSKGSLRPQVPFLSLYDEKMRGIIEVQFAREMRYFGFRFPEER